MISILMREKIIMDHAIECINEVDAKNKAEVEANDKKREELTKRRRGA